MFVFIIFHRLTIIFNKLLKHHTQKQSPHTKGDGVPKRDESFLVNVFLNKHIANLIRTKNEKNSDFHLIEDITEL